MTERKSVYLKEYLEVHNDTLKKHKDYRPDMKFTQTDSRGCLTLDTRDKILAPEDQKIFEEVSEQVAKTYKLLIA